jgi:energy-coupling factor transporter ATP-binding protein EcfA2
MSEETASSRAAQPSIVQYFRIEGLHGYRTISLESDYAATILIAKNGSGKTTLLAALDAFLKGQFSRLRELRFLRLCCKLKDFPGEIVLTQEDISKYTSNQQIESKARRIEIDTGSLLLFLEEYAADTTRLSSNDDIGGTLLQKFGYTRADAHAHCDRLKASLYDHVPAIQEAWIAIGIALKNVEVVYLPTYRRIELAVTPTRTDRYGRLRKNVLPTQKPGLYPGDIQFGLSDVVDRLSQLNQRIVIDSSLGYREISASIINELISGQFDRADLTHEERPDRAELLLFFSRLKEDRRHQRPFGPYFDVSIPNIEQIYTDNGGNISQESNKFLRFFLGKLNSVVQSTREIEALVQDFIDSCNKYLSSVDVSTTVAGGVIELDPNKGEADSKILTLSRRDLTISVDSLGARRKVPLNSLSSGEKQMISLFAKLFLYPPKEKLILIDEPELSLSIDWQRQILVDIIGAPLCRQLVAITHSPFVFDNYLEPFARSLTSTIDLSAPTDPPLGDDEFEADSHD